MADTNQINKLIHDLRNPLNTISVNAELARLSLEKGGPSDAAIRAMIQIVTECRRCSEILEGLQTEDRD